VNLLKVVNILGTGAEIENVTFVFAIAVADFGPVPKYHISLSIPNAA